MTGCVTVAAHRLFLEPMLAQDFSGSEAIEGAIGSSPMANSNSIGFRDRVWKMQPLGGDRRAMAIFSARIARSRFMRLLTAQPRSRGENAGPGASRCPPLVRGPMASAKIQPSLAGPDVADIARPFPAWADPAAKSPIEQVRRNVERMIAVCSRLEFACSFQRLCRSRASAVQPVDAPHRHRPPLSSSVHSWPAIAAEAQARLFLDYAPEPPYPCAACGWLRGSGKPAVHVS